MDLSEGKIDEHGYFSCFMLIFNEKNNDGTLKK